MNCWKCGVVLYDIPRKLSFRAICETCSAWLHCCRNCTNFKPGLPNNCAVPGTKYIADREASNFCEDFQILGKVTAPAKDKREVENRLFGNISPNASALENQAVDESASGSPPSKKSAFDALFGDSEEKGKS